MNIRELQIEDAEQFLNLINITEGETPYLLYEKGERKTTIEQEKEIILKGKKKRKYCFCCSRKRKISRFCLGRHFYRKQKKTLP